MQRPASAAMLTMTPAGLPGPSRQQCYQESPRFVHPRLRRSAAQFGGNIKDYAHLKMPPGTSIVPDMNDASVPSGSDTYDVVVIGGGPAGLASAIALAQTGASTALIARHTPYADNRTTALLGGSVDFLEAL